MPVAGWYVVLFPRDFLLGGTFLGARGRGKEFSELVTQGKGKKESHSHSQNQNPKPKPNQAKGRRKQRVFFFFFSPNFVR